MTWRVAYSLDQLLKQINTLAPNRSKASDGSIGDAEHKKQGSASDHNPWFVLGGQALVTARDFTHDPANGLDCNKLAAALIAAKDPRIKYLIWQGRLIDSRAVAGNGYRPWTWQPSSGHHQHLHLSVMANASADDTRPWSLPGLTEEDDMQLSELIEFRPHVGGAPRNLWDGQSQILAVLGVHGDMLAAIAKDENITPEFFAATLDESVQRHTPTAEQVAAAQLPHLQDAIRAALGQDNQALAEQIITGLGERLRAAAGQ